MQFVDTHTHLDFVPQGHTIEEWLERAKGEGVFKIITIGTSVEASRICAEIANGNSDEDLKIFASVGIHAEDGKETIEKYGDKYTLELKKIVRSSKKVVGIGECGFDFRKGTTANEKKFQEKLFLDQINLAEELRLPLIVHCRDAWRETFDLLKDKKISRVVFHSWTGDWSTAEYAIELGYFISFSGIVTFENAPKVAEVASKIPIHRMLLETDSPFLSPEPLRGLGNEPKNVRIIAEFVAKLRNLPLDEFSGITSNNAGRLFGI